MLSTTPSSSNYNRASFLLKKPHCPFASSVSSCGRTGQGHGALGLLPVPALEIPRDPRAEPRGCPQVGAEAPDLDVQCGNQQENGPLSSPRASWAPPDGEHLPLAPSAADPVQISTHTVLMERQTIKLNPLISYLSTIIQASPRGLRPDNQERSRDYPAINNKVLGLKSLILIPTLI